MGCTEPQCLYKGALYLYLTYSKMGDLLLFKRTCHVTLILSLMTYASRAMNVFRRQTASKLSIPVNYYACILTL